MDIEVLECVRFKKLPECFGTLIKALRAAAEDQRIVPVITGAAYEDYSKGGYHDSGYAWDVRIRDVPDPVRYICFIYNTLSADSWKWRMVYGDVDHTDHIHIEYRNDFDVVAEGE